MTSILSGQLNYTGPGQFRYDLRIYNGPDTPQLISPVNGYTSTSFQPDLIAVAQNCDHLEFQMDTSPQFNTSNLIDWTVSANPNTNVTTEPPTVIEVAGTWYWRTRAILNGIYGAWSDYRLITIPAIPINKQALYCYVAVTLEQFDPIQYDRGLVIDVEVGVEEITDISYQLYTNDNVEDGIGDVIYPIKDSTPARTTTMPGDSQVWS